MKIFREEDLRKGNGRSGRRTLVAVEGKVYDLSSSEKWQEGLHMNRHQAGRDLTVDLGAAPHGPEVLERFKQVGNFKKTKVQPPTGTRGAVEIFLSRYPFFRRHPHPAVVHVPVGVMILVPVLEMIGLLAGSSRTEWAAYCCLIAVLVSLPAAIASGYFTWWVNYEARENRIVKRKISLAWIAFFVTLGSVLLRAWMDAPLDRSDPAVAVYLCAILLLTVTISAIGFLGGNLTIPYH